MRKHQTTSDRLEAFVEWLDGRHMPAIEDDDQEMIAYVVRHHESVWNCHSRPIPAARTPKGWED